MRQRPPRQATRAAIHVERFLVVICGKQLALPLSTFMIDGSQANWVSANRRVAAWVWPSAPQFPLEGRLQVQVGGHGPGNGHFVAIALNAMGQGSIRQDEFGLAPLYLATHRHFSFVSNRPDQLASAWHRVAGREPERDLQLAALLAFKGHAMGDRTGYRDIRCVPFASSLNVSPAGVRIMAAPSLPWCRPEHPVLASEADQKRAIDEVEAQLITEMKKAVAGKPTYVGRPVLQLTGGRDSRLTVALALRSGVIDDLDVITHGDPRTADVRTAREVAAAANVKHSLHPWDLAPRSEFARARQTSGALNLREASEPPPPFGRTMIISGLLGETLRSNFPTTAPLNARSQVLRAFFGTPNLDLLTEPAWVATFAEALHLLMAPLTEGASTEDLYDAFYVQHRIRRWISVRPNAFLNTFFPLYSPPAARLAFALGWQARACNLIHERIIARAGHGLRDIPYASEKHVRRPWRTTIAYPEDGAPILERAELRQIARAWRPNRPRWRGHRPSRRRPHSRAGKLVALYRELIAAKRENPAFDVIDKQRLLLAIDALPSMSPNLAKQVHGAMTSVIWVGELSPSRGAGV